MGRSGSCYPRGPPAPATATATVLLRVIINVTCSKFDRNEEAEREERELQWRRPTATGQSLTHIHSPGLRIAAPPLL